MDMLNRPELFAEHVSTEPEVIIITKSEAMVEVKNLLVFKTVENSKYTQKPSERIIGTSMTCVKTNLN